MERLSVPRIIISGLTDQVGKSLVVIGLATALRKKGLSVSCCVIGPNFHQAVLLKGITERYVHVIDPNLQSQGQMLESVYMASIGADIVIIEGSGTLLEQLEQNEFAGGTDSYIAKLIYTPICPIFNATYELEDSIRILSEELKILKGVVIGPAIANKVSPDQTRLLREVATINDALVAKGQAPLLGVVPEMPSTEGLIPHGILESRKKQPLSRQFLIELSDVVARCIDTDELMKVAKKAPTVILEDYRYVPAARNCRIAVNFDNVFGLCFQDNLSFLKFYGADVVPFSMLADSGLPKGTGGIYLTGGFLTEYAKDLLRNTSMIRSLRTFKEQGGAIYSEGSSSAFLCREFVDAETRVKTQGVGILPATAISGDNQEWYFKGAILEDSVLGDKDMIINGICTGNWHIKNPERMIRCLRMLQDGQARSFEGFSPAGQVFSTFSFLHWGTNPTVAKNFVAACSVVKS